MKRDFFKGISFGLGLVFILSLLGLVYAVGFHIAEEILPGTFTGNYTFEGNVNLSTGELYFNDGTSQSTAASSIGFELKSLSGSSVNFTGIPNGTKRITISVSQGIASGANWIPGLQIGDSGGFETTGYDGTYADAAGSAGGTLSTSFLSSWVVGSGGTVGSVMILTLVDNSTNTWAFSAVSAAQSSNFLGHAMGDKSLSGTLDRIRVTTGGSATFSAGKASILYE